MALLKLISEVALPTLTFTIDLSYNHLQLQWPVGSEWQCYKHNGYKLSIANMNIMCLSTVANRFFDT